MEEKYNFFDDFKKRYKANDIDGCIACLIALIIEYNCKIGRNEVRPHKLKHILFQTNCIKNPMGMNYRENDYLNTINIFSYVEKFISAANSSNIDASDKFDNSIYTDIWDVLMYTEVLYKMNESNSRRMQLNKFSQEPFIVQLLTSVLFFQDQYRLLEKEILSSSNKDYFTGMELSIANKPVTYHEEIKVSVTDSMECNLEAINEIVRFLYYQFKKDFVDEINFEDLKKHTINPYNNPSFQIYSYIAIQRHTLQQLEEGIRYGFFTFECIGKDIDDNDVIMFSFEESKKSHARFCGIYRRERDYRTNVLMNPELKESFNIYCDCISNQGLELVKKQSVDFIVFDLSNYHISIEEYEKANKTVDAKINAIHTITKQYYLNSEVKGVKITDLLVCYRFISTIAEIIKSASLNYKYKGENNNYLKEISIVELDYLSSELSRLSGYDLEYSSKLIDRFVFHVKDNKYDDVFSQPLLKISNKQVILSPALVDQINPDRAIERQFTRFNKDTSQTGTNFETQMRDELVRGYRKSIIDIARHPIPNLSVNTNIVKYVAFDEKDIEFDLIMVLDDYLILTELKAIMTSYDISDLIERKSNIKDAIEQLKRRKESVIKDWNTFKSCVSINLSDTPFDSEHIILVACSDAYDFTPLQVDEIFITDGSTYLKYFTNPYIDKIYKDNALTGISHNNSLWSKGYPTANEFMDYLRNPITTQYIDALIKTNYLPLPFFDEEDLRIAIADCQLDKDPTVNQLIQERPKKKVSKNSRCPCGSGKKFKKCCKGKGIYD